MVGSPIREKDEGSGISNFAKSKFNLLLTPCKGVLESRESLELPAPRSNGYFCVV